MAQAQATKPAVTASGQAVQTVETPIGPVVAVEHKPTMAVRFSPPTYIGKPDKDGKIARPNVAYATLIGAMTRRDGRPLKVQLDLLTLAAENGTVTIYSVKRSIYAAAADGALKPLMRAPAATLSADFDIDGSQLLAVKGSKEDMAEFEQAIRDAWAAANSGGSTKWGVEFPLHI